MRITGMTFAVIMLMAAVGYGQTKEEKAKTEFAKGNQFHEKGDHDKAIACFTQAIRLHPDPAIYLNRVATPPSGVILPFETTATYPSNVRVLKYLFAVLYQLYLINALTGK